MGMPFWIATALFLLAYGLIVTEKIHKTIVAIFGAALMIVLKIVTQEDAFHSLELGIDWNVIFLLVSMMIIINIMKPTGVFEYIAIKSAKVAKGEPFKIMAIFSVVTAVVSALLDNVTTVLLISPVTFLICQALELDAVPFLITVALASNIGGTATLIGDPPNIMIASKAQLEFMDFIYHLGPVVIVVLIAYIISIKFIFGKKMHVKEELRQKVMAMNENDSIKDPVLLKKSLVVLVIIIGGVVKVGLIKWMSIKVLEITQGNLLGTSMIVMWFSAFASAFIDNIPYVATMNPLIIDMAKQLWPNVSGIELLHHPDLMPIWWSLALGACLGGNGTAIGASANVIIVGMGERMGSPISFKKFMLYGMPLMIESVIICMGYAWLRYYVLKI